MLCLLWSFFSFLRADFPPFTQDELPAERVINIWKTTDGQKVYYPIHFGPTGTYAWESVFLALQNFDSIAYGMVDCFCGGDELTIYITCSYLDGPAEVVPVAPFNPTSNCQYYSESFEECLASGKAWGYANFLQVDPPNPFLNFTFSTRNSPYGGGIAYFWYQSPAE